MREVTDGWNRQKAGMGLKEAIFSLWHCMLSFCKIFSSTTKRYWVWLSPIPRSNYARKKGKLSDCWTLDFWCLIQSQYVMDPRKKEITRVNCFKNHEMNEATMANKIIKWSTEHTHTERKRGKNREIERGRDRERERDVCEREREIDQWPPFQRQIVN